MTHPLRDGSTPRVLLIGWDAADWKMLRPLIDAGRMPNMRRFVDEGISGNVATLAPVLSPILWTSIATGKYADKHGILGFVEPDGTTGKVRPVTSTSRTCHALWNIISDCGKRAGAINWYASHPAEPINGFVVSDRFCVPTGPLDPSKPDLGWSPPPRSVHPAELLDALGRVRVHPQMIQRAQVAGFIDGLEGIESLAADDPAREPALKKISELRVLLAHCATVHSAATALMQDEPWDFLGIYYDAIDRMAHAFMEYHPPRMAHVSEEDFARYSRVMTECYAFHDLMLGRLMKLAGDDTVVMIVSDHGFHCDHLRPAGSASVEKQPVAWHRPYGVLALWGPGIKKGEKLYGATLLDVAPTVLTLLGIPTADDMDGSPLLQIFEEAPDVRRVPTHEPATPRAAAEGEDDPWVAQQVLKQLQALGYVGEDNADKALVDRLRNLTTVFMSTGRLDRALDALAELEAHTPDDLGLRVLKGEALLRQGRLDEAEAVLVTISAEDDAPRADLYRGMIASARGDVETALECYRRVEASEPTRAGIHTRLGQIYLRRGLWDDAERAFDRALELDSDDAEAHDGRGLIYRHKKDSESAVLSHMWSIALLHQRPSTHVHLGLALADVGRVRWAAEAFHVALGMDPDLPLAHRCLAELYERALGDPDRAATHRARWRELLRARAGEEGA